MDISASKVNLITITSTSTTASAAATAGVKPISDSKIKSTSSKSELAIKSDLTASDNKTEKKPLKIEDVQQMTAALNRFLQLSNAGMQFALHQKTEELMVQFVDTKSGQVLKEFPSHEFLDTMANIRDYVGILLDKHI